MRTPGSKKCDQGDRRSKKSAFKEMNGTPYTYSHRKREDRTSFSGGKQ